MPSIPSNLLRAVATLNKSELGLLQNYGAFLSSSNTLFDDFQSKIVSNLGTTVNMRLPYRLTVTNGLTPTLQGIAQILHPLTVDQAVSTNCAISDQERLFNLKTEEYIKEVAVSAVAELGSTMERLIALNVHSGLPVNTGDFRSPTPTGALHTESGPYRFYGDGVTPINSFEQLAQAMANFHNFGSVKDDVVMILPDVLIPAIAAQGLQQFAMVRNNELAGSWHIGDFGSPKTRFLTSNMLPNHISGTIGNAAGAAQILTITGLVTDSSGAITALQCSTPDTTDSQAVLSGDLMVFNDGVGGQTNVRFLTYIGHSPCAQKVQVRATATCASSGGTVTIPIHPYLISAPGRDQNVSTGINVGMKLTVMPNHLCGLLMSGKALFTAMPKLPTTSPYESSVETDPETGVSMRMWYGFIIDQMVNGLFRNVIMGSTLVPPYSMRLLFPMQ